MLHVPDAKAQMTGPLERKLSLQTFSYTRPNVPAKLIRKGSLTNPPLPFIPKYVYSYRGWILTYNIEYSHIIYDVKIL